VLGRRECEARGMERYFCVAQGSETEFQFLHITYKPKNGKINRKTGAIGKGHLFDKGGYNVKSALVELVQLLLSPQEQL